MGLTTTASGAWSYHTFCATIGTAETVQPNIFTMHVIPDEEDADSFQPRDLVEPPSPGEDVQEKALTKEDDFMAS